MQEIWGVAAILTKLLLYIGVAGSAGLVLVHLMFADVLAPLSRRLRVQTLALVVLALAATLLGFLLRGAALTGDAEGMTDPEMLGLLWDTPVGDVLMLRLAGLGLILIGLVLPGRGRWLAPVGGVLALWSFAQIGHVPDVGLIGVRLLLLLHLLGIAFWIGVLSPLAYLAQHPPHLHRAAQLGHRFGQVAALIVPLLIVAGVLMAWLLLGDLSALVLTQYGQTLLLKLSAVALVLLLAAANKLRFVPAMRAGDQRAAAHLVRSVRVETWLILAVLMATAVLTSVMTLPR